VADRRTASLCRACGWSAPATLAAAVLSLFPSPARADAVVNLCQDADQEGSGNLRKALLATPNSNDLINHIIFQCGGAATITISSPLEIFQATSLDGANANQITLTSLSSSGRSSLFVVANPGSFLYLNNLTLTHPNTTLQGCPDRSFPACVGSVVNGQGVTQLNNDVVRDSDTPIVVTSGSLTVFQSQFTGNSGTVIVEAPGMSDTTITGSVFQNNAAAPFAATGSVIIKGSQFLSNSFSAGVGAPCALTIDTTVFDGAKSRALGAACDTTISNSTFTNNSGDLGGAVSFSNATQITLRADKFLSNGAGEGGALYWRPPTGVDRSLLILYSTFKDNTAAFGGAIRVNDSTDLSGKTMMRLGVDDFSHNVATASGGAIFVGSTELTVERGIFADNRAAHNGGAIFLGNASPLHSVVANTLLVRNDAPTGGAFLGDDTDIINSTVDSNKGVAIADIVSQRTGLPINFTNSIVSNNPQGGCGPAGLFDDAGHNLQFPGTDCGSSIRVANPRLDSMYIPLPGSPPMGNGDLTVCMAPPINGRDVYGMGRPSGGVCTTGAAEGDIEAIVNRGRNPNRCDCDFTLLRQLQRALPYR
jgi:predicted outer membrane repeat protein